MTTIQLRSRQDSMKMNMSIEGIFAVKYLWQCDGRRAVNAFVGRADGDRGFVGTIFHGVGYLTLDKIQQTYLKMESEDDPRSPRIPDTRLESPPGVGYFVTSPALVLPSVEASDIWYQEPYSSFENSIARMGASLTFVHRDLRETTHSMSKFPHGSEKRVEARKMFEAQYPWAIMGVNA